MFVRESSQLRRLVGRLERGDDILRSFADLAERHGVTTGWVSGLGAFEWLELVEYDQVAQRYKSPKRFDTPMEILSLTGNISLKDGAPFVHIHTCVSRETDNGVQVVGGHLIAGRVFACEFSVECHDDLELERSADARTGLALWSSNRTDPGSAEQGVSWAHVASAAQPTSPAKPPSVRPWAASKSADWKPAAPSRPARNAAPSFTPPPLPTRRRQPDETPGEEPVPTRGEFIEHKQFGLCRVEGEDLEGGLLISLPSGARKVISLEFFSVSDPREDNGRRIYTLSPRRR
jgi:uncharacterized protein